MGDAFGRAVATLNRGATFLGTGLRGAPKGDMHTVATPISGPYRAKVIANGLRELDRFLNLLIDEALRAQGQQVFPVQRNTANKLAFYCAAHGRRDDHSARLRALGRSRACLFHCGGRVLRGDRRDATTMTAGWPELPGTQTPLRQFRVGEMLVLDAYDLADIGGFYRRLACEIGILAEPDIAAWR